MTKGIHLDAAPPVLVVCNSAKDITLSEPFVAGCWTRVLRPEFCFEFEVEPTGRVTSAAEPLNVGELQSQYPSEPVEVIIGSLDPRAAFIS